ncbi:MAG: glycosyltransferase family 4 protein [Anaerolineae bacterium]|nr:glycosyltransferase family 4 protein [Anaerolineae bacterium]
MNVGFISTRLAGNDGVSLETVKWAKVLERMGHTIFYCAGELEEGGSPGALIPEMHFDYPENTWIRAHSYGTETPHPELRDRIDALKNTIKPQIEAFINDYRIDLIIPQNIFAVPIQLSLALALAEIIKATGIPTVSHEHDYYWERTVYEPNCVSDILDTVFPPDLPSIRHAVISSIAQKSLKQQRGIDATIVPNVFDFETPAPGLDDFNADFREAVGLSDDDRLILEPVRIIHRKGIELAIEAISRLNDPRCKFILTHGDDLDQGYLYQLQAQAEAANVDMHLVTDRISSSRKIVDGQKTYSLWDAYVHADFVMYPSLYEGFGNALLETVYFKRPMLVNNYIVYAADIGPLGFEFIELDGAVTDEVVAQLRDWLDHPQKWQSAVEHNYDLALHHFSYAVLERLLNELIAP